MRLPERRRVDTQVLVVGESEVRTVNGQAGTADGALRGRVALVTGAARGLGRGIAACLGEAGATVYLTDRDARASTSSALPGTVEDTAEEVDARGGTGIPIQVDHTDDEQVEAAFARIAAEQPSLDIVVGNVFGGNDLPFGGGPFWTLPVRLWDLMFTAGLRAHLMTARLAVPLLRPRDADRDGGLVVFTGFAGGTEPEPVLAGNLYYDLAMTGTSRLAGGLAHELRQERVTVVVLSPGFVRTEAVVDSFGGGPLPPGTESVEYTGRAVVALATDPERGRHSGATLRTAELASAYGFTDVDGTQPSPP